ncbi:unnamed protein product [Adineta ricciae]|uniref:Uncharacterized protein n=1 Tax=Adineta ricciae TaxID=249248 RepID=A0A814N0V8_ADIRI|nr:unnamed protein product [Adineta ricciae]
MIPRALLSQLTSCLFSKIHLRILCNSRNYSQCTLSPTELPPALNASFAESETSKNDHLNSFLIRHVLENQSTASPSFSNLFEQLNSKANLQLPHILLYENMGRKNVTNQADLTPGIVTIAHVLPSIGKVIVASGFAIHDGGLIVTCAHTFYQAVQHLSSSSYDSKSKSIVITHDGNLIGIAALESHLVRSDLVILRLQHEHKLPSLAVDPYPAPTTTSLLTYDFQTVSLSPTSTPTVSYSWKLAEVLCYRGPCGQEAQAGTYDELTSMMHSHPSSNGSSGGPIVNKETRSVVGIVRGSEVNYTNRKRIGFAIPSEHLYDAFRLPGMPDDLD